MQLKQTSHTVALFDVKPNCCLYYWISIIYQLESVLGIQTCLWIRHQTRMSSTADREKNVT